MKMKNFFPIALAFTLSAEILSGSHRMASATGVYSDSLSSVVPGGVLADVHPIPLTALERAKAERRIAERNALLANHAKEVPGADAPSKSASPCYQSNGYYLANNYSEAGEPNSANNYGAGYNGGHWWKYNALF